MNTTVETESCQTSSDTSHNRQVTTNVHTHVHARASTHTHTRFVDFQLEFKSGFKPVITGHESKCLNEFQIGNPDAIQDKNTPLTELVFSDACRDLEPAERWRYCHTSKAPPELFAHPDPI